MSVVRSVVRPLVPGASGGSIPVSRAFTVPEDVELWDFRAFEPDAVFSGSRLRTATIARAGIGDGKLQGAVSENGVALEVPSGISDCGLLPFLGGCTSLWWQANQNASHMRRTVSITSAYDWCIGAVVYSNNYEGSSSAATSGGAILGLDQNPIVSDFMGVGLYRKDGSAGATDGGKLTFRRQGTAALTDYRIRAGGSLVVINSRSTGLTITVDGVTSTFAALDQSPGGSPSVVIQDATFGMCLSESTVDISNGSGVGFCAKLLCVSRALTDEEIAQLWTDARRAFRLPAAGAAATVIIGDSMPGYTGDSNAAAVGFTGSLALQIADANRDRIVWPICHGALPSFQIDIPTIANVDRVLIWCGINDCYLRGKSDEALYIADQTARRAQIMSDILATVSAVKAEYPDAEYWMPYLPPVDQAQYDAENTSLTADKNYVNAQLLASPPTGVTMVDFFDEYTTVSTANGTHVDRIHISAGMAAYIVREKLQALVA